MEWGGSDAFQDFKMQELVGNQKEKKRHEFQQQREQFAECTHSLRRNLFEKNQIKKVEF